MILDTNAYTALVLGWPEIVAQIRDAKRLGLPLPVIAELKQGFLKGTRLEANTKALEQFMARTDVDVIMPDIDVAEQYASLQHYAIQKGRALGNNDVWIAALAIVDGDKLITYDRDFLVFEEMLGEQLVLLKHS